MATVTGFTAQRMLEIENASVVDGEVDTNGDLILSTQGGTNINAGHVVGPQGPPNGHVPRIAKFWDSSTVAITSAQDTGVVFSTKVTDPGYEDPAVFGSFSGAQFQWSGPSGIYRITAYVIFSTGTGTGPLGTRRIMGLFKNATSGEANRFARNDGVAKASGSTPATSGVQCAGTVALAPGDYIQVTAYQDSGQSLNITWRWFEIELIKAT